MKRSLFLILALAFMAVSGCATTSGEKSAFECDSAHVYAGLGSGSTNCG